MISDSEDSWEIIYQSASWAAARYEKRDPVLAPRVQRSYLVDNFFDSQDMPGHLALLLQTPTTLDGMSTLRCHISELCFLDEKRGEFIPTRESLRYSAKVSVDSHKIPKDSSTFLI